MGGLDALNFHGFAEPTNPRSAGCGRCGRAKDHPIHGFGPKRVLVNPASRRAAEPQIKKLGLPVQETGLVPAGQIYIFDPDALEPIDAGAC